jgi:hypothetical protein
LLGRSLQANLGGRAAAATARFKKVNKKNSNIELMPKKKKQKLKL